MLHRSVKQGTTDERRTRARISRHQTDSRTRRARQVAAILLCQEEEDERVLRRVQRAGEHREW